MSDIQSIFNIAEICSKHGIENAILSPGSRSAPLTLAFARHPQIKVRTISDERSAAFIALGIAQYTKKPVALICTSGSAAYNYAPAIAEAYYQQIPLLILSADRPPEWIDQYDGQTIKQDNIFDCHVKANFSLPVDLSHEDAKWHMFRQVNEAINKSKQLPSGPVHINVPLREPLYPENLLNSSQQVVTIPFIEEENSMSCIEEITLHRLKDEWQKYRKRLIVVGQLDELPVSIANIASSLKLPIVADVISNGHKYEAIIRHVDLFLGTNNLDVLPSLQPDLLITFGKSVISKNLKLFFRKYKPMSQWHIQPFGDVADTFQSLTKIVRTSPELFFTSIPEKEKEQFEIQKQENFYNIWDIEERKVRRHIEQFKEDKQFNELDAYKTVLSNLPRECSLHVANSMAVRYVNFIGLRPSQGDINVFANRGTSGIDGSNSTAVGSALVSNKTTVLLTGDMAFFYDRNAFWHNYNVPNLKIIVFNNHGGGIFNMIKGPSDQPEYKEFFETNQILTAKHLTDEYGFEYIHCNRTRKLKNSIKALFDSKTTAILEIETDSDTNKDILNSFKNIKNT